MRGQIILATVLAMSLLSGHVAMGAGESFAVNDETATESLEHWNSHYVPSLALSDEAKVGKHSIMGDFGTTQSALFQADMKGKTSFDLTQYARMRFWAKAAKKNDNVLVMLLSSGFANRRDTLITVDTEWKQYDLALDEKTFSKNVTGNSDLARVGAIAFYNNSGFADRIWIDGLEFVKPEKPAAAQPQP